MMAFIRVITLALALASCSVWSSHPSESERNQYEARKHKLQLELLTKATDHRPEVHPSESAYFSSNTTNSTQLTSELRPENIRKLKGTSLNVDKFVGEKFPFKSRRERSYQQWPVQISYQVPYPSITQWQPPIYALSRPYFIPFYGAPGRVPIFYPPQPIYVNPDTPKVNPRPPFQGPSYLPPVKPTTEPTTTVSIFNRFDGGDKYDDRPVWNGDSDRQPATTEIVPTRVPRPPGANVPPLVHKPTDPKEYVEMPSNIGFTTQRPLTTRAPQGSNEPSRCVWAIISCCSSSNQVIYECFEQRGCSGAFWDNNPCESEFARAAIAAALNYYSPKK